jgi:dienelactone hydrolase
MQKQIKLRVSGGKYIYGHLQGGFGLPVIIFVHGYKGSKDESKYIHAANYFEKLGYATFRFNLYSKADGAKRVEDTTLSEQAGDLDVVLGYFKREGFPKIYVVAHSMGGLVILLTKKKIFDAAVLWDGAVDTKLGLEDLHKVSLEMFEEINSMDPLALIQATQVPIKLIWAENSILRELENNFYKSANQPKDNCTIKGASHDFSEPGVEDELFRETYAWFKSY